MQDERAAAPATPQPRSVLERTAIGMGWIVGWRLATRVLGLVSTLVLIRLLAPGDFGLVSLAFTFVIAMDTLSALGVEDSLVREPHLTAAMYDTGFTLNLIRSCITAILLGIGALPIAAFFDEPRLAYVLWALAAGALIAGMGSIGVVDFRRDINFAKEFVLQILPRVLSILVTIGVAVIWRSHWALVAGILTGQTVRSAFSYRMHPWRPRLSLAAWRHLVGFSAWTWAITMATLVRDRMNAFALGRTLDATAVGIYAIGDEIAALPTTELVLPLCRSCFSGFAADRAAGRDVTETFLRPAALMVAATLPAGLGLSLVADPLVRLLVGEQWVQAIPVIQVLGVMGALATLGSLAGALLSAYGMLQTQFVAMLACVGLRLALILPLMTAYGVTGAALNAAAGMAVEQTIMLVAVVRYQGIPARLLLLRIWRSIAAAAAMAAVLVGTGWGWTAISDAGPHLAQTLAAAVALGAATYAAVLAALWFLAGRPEGPEMDALALVRRITAGLLQRVMPTRT